MTTIQTALLSITGLYWLDSYKDLFSLLLAVLSSTNIPVKRESITINSPLPRFKLRSLNSLADVLHIAPPLPVH